MNLISFVLVAKRRIIRKISIKCSDLHTYMVHEAMWMNFDAEEHTWAVKHAIDAHVLNFLSRSLLSHSSCCLSSNHRMSIFPSPSVYNFLAVTIW